MPKRRLRYSLPPGFASAELGWDQGVVLEECPLFGIKI